MNSKVQVISCLVVQVTSFMAACIVLYLMTTSCKDSHSIPAGIKFPILAVASYLFTIAFTHKAKKEMPDSAAH